MTKTRKKFRSIALGTSLVLMAGTLVASQVLPVAGKLFGGAGNAQAAETPVVSEFKGTLDTGIRTKLATDVVQALPKGLGTADEISIIVKTADDALLEAYESQSSISRYATVGEFSVSAKGMEVARRIENLNAQAKTLLERTGVKFTYGAQYDVLLGGFEVVAKAGDYAKLAQALKGTGFKASISEVYEKAEAQLVENDVNVHDTGIFNSDGTGYDGTGTVIAVLDTGLDYTHTAFDPERFTSDHLAMTQSSIASKLGNLRSAQYSRGISAADLYINEKVPYGYDYADKDTDVYPLESEHGTHVSGIIVGLDEKIRGVAPNAQLVSMKVFSDTTSGARWSWILGALEDCVTLEVDVINMSLGSSCGFSIDSEAENEAVYKAITAHGISLVAAASNDYSSNYGSVKNGNLGLTSNPDTATVGSPSTYSASLSVASISGVKTPYLTYNGQIIYFTESANASSEPRNFVDDILPAGVDEMEFEYVTIPGIGRSADYMDIDVQGKIALVARGDTTFEEKAKIAQSKGAAGVIIRNNVSGDITMTVGNVKAAVCSISQDNGEMLAANETGKIRISRSQVAGPFMSNFSSWGPTPDLRIKPEITAHGGDILSAVPGQDYDRLSGTSMASPNQAGVTALIRQYVVEKFPNASRTEALALVNQLMMSTADIAYNVNALPYSVRKQGAGLTNLTKVTSTPAYISTYARNDAAIADGSASSSASTRFTDEIMDKAKIEYGDDKTKSGVYEMVFNINNISEGSLTYDVDAIVMTEGISKTRTHKLDMTVTEEGYLLEGAKVTVESVEGGTRDGNAVTVAAGKSAKVVVRIELSDSDKQYLEQTFYLNGEERLVFKNGIYVEGYITLTPTDGNPVNLNVPYLAFYGDWTKAPIFDLDYFETDKDDRDDSIPTLDKTLPDKFATTPIGGLYNDYISALGSYYFIQPSIGTQISADRKYIALTNQTDQGGGVNYIYGIYAGMLRGAKRVEMTITDTTTGEVIWTRTEENVRQGKSGTSPSYIEVDFHVADYDLKNNTQYLFRAEAFLDYAGEQNNEKDVFEFPFVTDFSAPVVTDAEFYTEYDNDAKKNKLFARVYVYDNHYAMGYQAGRVYAGDGGVYLDTFSRLPVAIHSEFNSTTEVVIELTDYITQMAGSYRPNTFVMEVYDYAMNGGIYEINIPDDIRYVYFSEMEDAEGNPLTEGEYGVTLSPNETYTLAPIVYPATEWAETLLYTIDKNGENVVRIVGGKILALSPGTATITATSSIDASVRAMLTVKVLSENDPGYEFYDKPVVESFSLTGYTTDYAYYFISNSDRDISVTGARTLFPANTQIAGLQMFPGEKITLEYKLIAYDPAVTKVVFESGRTDILRVNEFGQITAVAEGSASISVRVMIVNPDGTLTGTLNEYSLFITVKNPYQRLGPYLTRYLGGGGDDGVVSIPEELGFTEIYQFAFTGYEYVPKDLSAGDVIDDEDPSYTKPWYYGDNQDVTTVILPEGIKVIQSYAFAGMTGLKKVVLPSTITRISAGAFYGCTNLTEIEGLEHVKFINKDAFTGPATMSANGTVSYAAAPLSKVSANSFSSIVAIGDNAFRGTGLTNINLPASAQSIGAYAFAGSSLFQVQIAADKIKLGAYAFANCSYLREIRINAAVIPDGVFEGCSLLSNVTLGRDVETIGANAFAGTNVSSFNVRSGNPHFKEQSGNTQYPYLLSADGTKLVYVAPVISGGRFELKGVTTVGANAFSGNTALTSVSMPDVTRIENNAFMGCTSLRTVNFGQLEEIGDYAFTGCALTALPAFSEKLTRIGAFAFAMTEITSVEIEDGMIVGDGAFMYCSSLKSVIIGNDVELGAAAFAAYAEMNYVQINVGYQGYANETTVRAYYTSRSVLQTLVIGDNVSIGMEAFRFAMSLKSVSLGENVEIGAGAFYNAQSLTSINLENVTSIGEGAFYGVQQPVYVVTVSGNTITGFVGLLGYLTDAQYSHSPKLTSVNLTSLKSLGASAFANNLLLTTVTLGEDLTEIPAEAFYNTALSSIDLSNVTDIGLGAFYDTELSEVDISRVQNIGALAFARTLLTNIELRDGALIHDQAFYGCTNLTTVVNLDKALKIGAGAFANTALSGELDLSSAISIGDLAFMNTGITGVRLSEDLLVGELPNGEKPVLGENPFAGCPMLPITITEDIPPFHGQSFGTETKDTFDVNESVKVIDGALYKVAPNGGYVLVSYPAASPAREFAVAEGTVRISAYAFVGSRVFSVVLPSTLRAIGDKAFFGCLNLSIVTFKSLKAPILEEQYNESWTDYLNNILLGEDGNYHASIPTGGLLGTLQDGTPVYGLGIVKFNVWNIDYMPTMFFFGANFVNYVGLVTPDIIMVRPANGENYDSFIYGLYFGTVLDGAVAADETTLAAIEAIKKIPDGINIQAQHRPIIEEARRLYDLIATTEQQALVAGGYDGTNYYNILTNAEIIIDIVAPVEKPEPPEQTETIIIVEDHKELVITLGVLVGVFGLATLAAFALLLLEKNKKRLAEEEAMADGGASVKANSKDETK